MTRFLKLALGVNVMLVCIGVCYCECPQHTFESASVHACADDKCLDGLRVRGCIGPDNVLDKTRGVTIWTKTPVWRRGAVHDLPELEFITAFTSGMSRLNPGAFLNLPKLKFIELTYGDLEEIQWGVFSNTTAEEILIGYNLVTYVENRAFSNMPNLKVLNLKRNNLSEIYQTWFENSYGLTTLILQYNRIEKIHAFMFSVFPELKYLDLSFNRIKEIGGGALDNVKSLHLLDLTSNKLSWITTNVFGTKTEVKELRLPLNQLSFLSTTVLTKGNVRSLSLHPNPWQCPCLDEVLKWMREHNATLNNPGDDHRIIYNDKLPECSFNPNSIDKCVVGYDDDFLKAQEIFFREVNYTNLVREMSTSVRPDFNTIATAKPFPAHLSPLQ